MRNSASLCVIWRWLCVNGGVYAFLGGFMRELRWTWGIAWIEGWLIALNGFDKLD